jgi:hypothetical protein
MIDLVSVTLEINLSVVRQTTAGGCILNDSEIHLTGKTILKKIHISQLGLLVHVLLFS